MESQRVVSSLVCKKELTVCISNDGEVYSFGRHCFGAHGHDTNVVLTPTRIPSLSKIVSIACGSNNTVCLNDSGVVFTLGSNRYGQLGIGVNHLLLLHSSTPQKLNLPPIKQVSCGDTFIACVTTTGDVITFGNSFYGQLGLGDNEDCYLPQKIESLKNVDFLECGYAFTICKTTNNEIYSWGLNEFGQLGINNNENQNTPILCTQYPNNIVDIKCGLDHTIVLTSNQKVYSCGKSGYIGRKTRNPLSKKYSPNMKKISELSEIIRIECGDDKTFCIDVNHDVFVFGYYFLRNFKLADKKNRRKPVKMSSLKNIVDISKGGVHTFVKTSVNEIYAFGINNFAQLGIEKDKNHHVTPIQVLKGNEDIWNSKQITESFLKKWKAKSARKR